MFCTAQRPHLLAMNVVNAVNFCKIRAFSGEVLQDLRFLAMIFFSGTETSVQGFEPLTSCMSKT